KKNAYLLPTMPAQTLLMAQGALLLAVWLKRKPQVSLPRIIVVAQACVGVGFALWLGWVLFFSRFSQPFAIAVGLWIAALIAAGYPMWRSMLLDRRDGRAPAQNEGAYRHWLVAQAVGY